MTKEVWKEVPNYKDYYVSNIGRVRSEKYKIPKILKSYKMRGYLVLNLSNKGIIKSKQVHRLVMLAFVGESELQVNHINGIKDDNRLENLEYCTASENIKHAYRTGLKSAKGENNSRSKLTDTQVIEIKRLLFEGYTQNNIERITGISKKNISRINTGKRWSHITYTKTEE